MDIAGLLGLIDGGEKVDVEFKLARDKVPHSVYETICAFNNRNGGHIILGVEDKTRTIVGVNPEVILNMQDNLATVLNNPNAISPTLYLELQVFDIDSKKLLYMYVPEGKNVCRYKKEYYDRNQDGDMNITGNQDLVYKLFTRKNELSYVEKAYPALDTRLLSSGLIDRVRRMACKRKSGHPWGDMDDEALLRSTGLVKLDKTTGNYGLTIASILLFALDDVIASVLPAYKTDAIFRIDNVDRYDDRDVISTNLLDSYNRLMAFGEKHLNDSFVLDGIVSVSARNKILREIFSNTLAHRDYSSRYPAKFVIERERMYTENSNIATSVGNLSLESFNPVPKNPLISKIFREIGIADELGSGMRNTNKYTKLYSQAEPRFIEGDIFRIEIPLRQVATAKVGG